MPLRARALLLVIVVVSCAPMHSVSSPVPAAAGHPAAPAPDVPGPSSRQLQEDTTPVWDGFMATHGTSSALAAYALSPLDVYVSPESSEPHTTLDQTTILGTVTVLAVISGPQSGWVEVMLPLRPNGSTGWVRTDQLSLYVVDGEIEVDLSERRLTYTVDDVTLLETEVGIGSDYNRTPEGHFFVTDNVTLANPDSPWGPHALGISARSESITDYNGGDGIIGIHGTNNPDSIGGDISLGCVRVPNDVITTLHQLVPLGTRVTVAA